MILVLYKLFSCLRGVMISILNHGLKTLHTSGGFILLDVLKYCLIKLGCFT